MTTQEKLVNTKELKASILELADQVQHHSDLYFNKATPEITDAEYDAIVSDLKSLVEQLEAIEPLANEVQAGKEVLNNVGSTPSYGKKVTHSNMMGSLEKAYSVEEIKEWYRKYAPPGGCKLIVTPKQDGCASRLNFCNGLLKEAATRGDGTTGQNVTDNVKAIQSIPKTLPNGMTVEVRGEIEMLRSVFKDLNEHGVTGANPRNLGTGSLLAQDPQETGKRNLNLFVYDVLGTGITFKTETEKRAWMVTNLPGFNLVDMQVITIDEFSAIALEWEGKRPSLDFDIDGIVISLDSIEAQEEAGWNGKRPNGKIAFKFRPEQTTAKIIWLDWQVGRTGRLTPMARVEPTQLAGSTIRNITLHNAANVLTKNIATGDEVLIEKAGEIIPAVVRVVTRSNNRLPADISKVVCPSCGGTVEMDENKVNLWCKNPACHAQLERRLIHWVKTLDLKGVGEGIVAQLCHRGFVNDVPDLYYLTEDQLTLCTGGRISAHKVQTAILEKNEIPLAVFLDGLGIDGLGTSSSKDVAKVFKTLNAVRSANAMQFIMPGIGTKTARKIVEGMRQLFGMIDALLQAIEVKSEVVKTGNLAGLSFVLTGAMSKPRKFIESSIESSGGENKGSVSKGVSYLVQSDPNSTSSKTEKANKVGTKIISEDTLWDMISGKIVAP